MGKTGKIFDTIGKWIVLAPVIALVIGGVWMLTAPGTDLSRRAFAELWTADPNSMVVATANGRRVTFVGLLGCPAELPASALMALEREGFTSARCTSAAGHRDYDLPLPISGWFYGIVGGFGFGYVRARRSKPAPATEPSPPA